MRFIFKIKWIILIAFLLILFSPAIPPAQAQIFTEEENEYLNELLKEAGPAQAACSKCGNQIPEGAAFCLKCGTKVLPPGQRNFNSEVMEIEEGLYKAETKEINNSVILQGETETLAGYTHYNKSDASTNRFKQERNDFFHTGFAIGIKQSVRNIVYKIQFDLNSPLSIYTKERSQEMDLFREGMVMELGYQGDFLSIDSRLGGPVWVISFSPLTGGNLTDEAGEFPFDDKGYGALELPLEFFKNTYDDIGTTDDERDTSVGAKGIYANFKQKQTGIEYQAWLAKYYNVSEGGYVYFNRILKSYNDFTFLANYTRLEENYMTRDPYIDWNVGSVGIERRNDANNFVNLYFEGAYSKAKNYIFQEEKYGGAGIARFMIKSDKLLFVEKPNFKINFYYASKYYFAYDNSYNFNCVQKVLATFSNEDPIPVAPITMIGNMNENTYTVYLTEGMDILKGKFLGTIGIMQDISTTPNLLNIKNGAFIQKELGKDIFYSSTELAITATTTNFENKTNAISKNVYSDKYYAHRKYQSLLRFHLSYNIQDIAGAKALPIPVYYYGRYALSGMFFNKNESSFNFNWPFSDNSDNLQKYNYQDHTMAIGVLPEFFLIGFIGFEKIRISAPENGFLYDSQDNDIKRNDYIQIHRNSLALDSKYPHGIATYDKIERTETGYGIGFTWWFSGGVELDFRLDIFKHDDKYNPENNFSGYRAEFFFAKKFSF